MKRVYISILSLGCLLLFYVPAKRHTYKGVTMTAYLKKDPFYSIDKFSLYKSLKWVNYFLHGVCQLEEN